MFQNWEFILGEIWGLIALAGLLGLFAGWLIWSRSGELRRLQSDLDERNQELEATKQQSAALTHEFEMERSALKEARDRALAAADKSALEATESNAELASAKAELQATKSGLQDAVDRSNEFEQKLGAARSSREIAETKLEEQATQISSLADSLSTEIARVQGLAKAKEERDAAIAARSKAQNDHANEIARVRSRDENITRIKSELHAANTEAKRALVLETELREVRAKGARVAELEAELGTLQEKAGQADQLESDLANAKRQAARAESLEAELSARDIRISALEQKIQSASASYQSSQTQQTEIDRLKSEVLTRDVVINELRAKAAAAPSSFASSQPDTSIPDYDRDGKLEGRNEGCKPAVLHAAQGGLPDDLKRIKGIGPKLEAMLNGLGFFHYDQMAAWSDDEVAWVDANLEGFNGRVSRDRWIEQAKVLASGGPTEFATRVDEGEVYDGS